MSLEEILELSSGCEVKLNGPDVFVGVYHSAWSHQRSLVLYLLLVGMTQFQGLRQQIYAAGLPIRTGE